MGVRAVSLLFLPEGECENSPGGSPPWRTEPWEHIANIPTPSRRDGRNLPPHVARIIFNVVFLEKSEELPLEIALPMVLFLACNVCQRGGYLSPSDGERRIAFLPCEVFHRAGFMHPARRCALDFSHRRCYRQRRRQRQQNMNVVLHSAYAERLHLVLARDTAHIGPQPRLDLRNNNLAPFPGGENAMKQRTTIGV
jgi:hypothetical protein